ncbi:DUF2306 domain-containing protein [Bradyrhizobium liaoningense]|uniref:DUF2306 domain-containing protein n=1 Tax=Bradyrhizobium liaoningense TaxID=43992 RepID=UPI001BAC063D|nr:DUF2306 domain-containing protein [Bradyrhizobium liaoningense]MBR0845899.1 DUF2306 domain-containing protein [Bradyrhizobium liaoningense]
MVGLAKVVAFIILSSVVLPAGMMAIALGSGSIPPPYPLYLVLQRLPIVFPLHMIASGLALILIPLALLLRHRPPLHRPIGRIAFCCIVVGALSALPVALCSEANAVARAGLFVQGFTWLALAAAAVHAIRSGNAANHARWMIAVAAIASAAIWLRLVTSAATVLMLPFEEVYAIAAWMCWIVPLAIVLAWTKRPTAAYRTGFTAAYSAAPSASRAPCRRAAPASRG